MIEKKVKPGFIFKYRRLLQSTELAHLIVINKHIRFWIPKSWIINHSWRKKRIRVKPKWAKEVKSRLQNTYIKNKL
jgi:hypothetical protein